MSKVKIGSKVRVKASGRTGVVEQVYDLSMWNVQSPNDEDCVVRFDDGTGALTISCHAVELIEDENYTFFAPKCECGLKFARSGGKHSDYCPLYKREE